MQKFLGKKKEIWFMFGKKKSDLCTKRLDKMYQVNHDLKKLVHGEHAHCFIFVWFIGTPHPHPHSDKIDRFLFVIRFIATTHEFYT